MINFYIKKKKANYSDYFGNRSDFLLKLKENSEFILNNNVEVMVHPDYNVEGILIDKAGKNEYDFIFVQSLKINIDQ